MKSPRSGYKKLSHVFPVFICLFFSSHLVCGQDEQDSISFDRISIPGIIRSSQVSDIIQDKDGVLWIIGNGLYRYDGFKFNFYRDVEGSDIKINGKEISAIYYDSLEHRILIATRNYGLMQYNYSSNTITRLVEQKGIPVINQITRTADGRLWAASFSNGVFHADQDTLKKVRYLHGGWPSCLLSDGKKLYIGQLTKVIVVEGDRIADSVDLSLSRYEMPPYTRISSLFRDRSNKLWIGTEKSGLFAYDLTTREFVRHLDPAQPPFFSKITRILQDREGLIWILTKANGLAVYDPSGNNFIHLQNNPGVPRTISGNNCFSILEDSNGIMWIGAIGDLNRYDRQKISFRHIRYNPQEQVSLSDNMVRGIYEDRNGIAWIGTDDGMINLYDRKRNSMETLKVKVPGDPLNYVAMYFTELNEHTMLIGSSLGLLQYERATHKFSPYKPLWEITKNKMIRQVILDGDMMYLIFSGHMLEYNMKSEALIVHASLGNKQAFNISVISIDDQKRLWAGVRGGVSYRKPGDKNFNFIPFEKTAERPDSVIMMVLSVQEFNDKVYAGTFNMGLWEIDIATLDNIPDPKNYTEADGLPNNTIYSSLPDNEGNLWISSNSGLSKFNPFTKKFIHFTVGEGLQDEEFNRLAFSRNAEGEMIFGGINGVNLFNPKDIKTIDNTDPPVITSLMVSNPFSEGAVNVYMDAKDNMKFSYEHNFVAFNFSVPNYHEPRRFAFLYKLEHFDAQWKEVQFENAATYSNLKPGDYTFFVKAVNLNGDEKVTKLSFTIVPPVWKTWWFIVLSFLVVALFVMTIIRSYIRRAQFDKQRLEGLLTIRTYEIEQSREELRALNQKKDLIFSILSHDLRSPLTTLKGFLGILIDNSDFLSKEDVKKHAINIRNSVTNSLDLIDNTLFWSLSQMGNIQYNPSAFSLKLVIEKVIGLYSLTAEKKKIKVSLDCDENIFILGDENMIYVTFRNILSNAIKFTREGKSVNIRCASDNTYAIIEIEDEGIGMSADYLNKVLSREQPMLKQGTSNEKGTGLGLLLCKNFLEINKGKLNITSTEHKGTSFIVTLPLAEHVTV